MSQRNWAEKPSGYEPARVYDVDDGPSRPDTIVYKRYSLFSCTEWVLEIITSIGSLIILAAVAVIFRTVNNQPLSNWTFPISLNAVISILTTACSAAIMHGLHFKNGPQKLEHLERFDEASRGPLGSLKFLVSMKWNLATIGALVTIFRLGLSPLAQQVVKIEERFIPTTDNNVTFGYTHTYNRVLDYPDLRTCVCGIPQDPGMQAAILQGLYDINTPATFTCPVACEWKGSYVSLGFTAECRNVTQKTLESKSCRTESPSRYNEYCNMTTPGNIGLYAQKVFTSLGTRFYMNASLAVEFPEISRFGIYQATPDVNFNQSNINITECSLSLAAYKYTGARSESTSFSFAKTEMIQFSGNRSGPQSDRHNILEGMEFTNGYKASDLPAFKMSSYDLRALGQFFTSGAIVTYWVDGYGPSFDNKVSGLSAAALAGDVDIGERFKKMAVSMTDYLRSGPNSKSAVGDRVDQIPYVSIRWWFFAGPVAIEALALLFAVLTIFSNRESSRVPLWKSSALAVLACEHEKKSELLRTTAKDIRKIEKTAKNSLVKLE
ncbi:hypothetical protein CCHR01_15028 [Colletotrichum chrysophilum]|uniref:Uncharacterized protein n=1 Tax=Colletotrichum chrysophilum TaxID=1836956 RepID=A0AAD9A746_9PEZI|nr:hypothetical protein CCHR01_15028 [Colletotrichum chrysophilum]